MQQPRIDVTAILHFSRARFASSRSCDCGHAAPVCQVCANVGDALPCTTRCTCSPHSVAGRFSRPRSLPRRVAVLCGKSHRSFPCHFPSRTSGSDYTTLETRRDACACTRCLRYINRRVTPCYFVVSPPSVALSRSTCMYSSLGCSIVRIERRLSIVFYRRIGRQTIRRCSERKIFGNGIGSSRRLEAA